MLPFRTVSEKLFFLREFTSCNFAESFIFEPQLEFFVLVLKYGFWIIRVNYLSAQGVHSSRGGKGLPCELLEPWISRWGASSKGNTPGFGQGGI